MSTRSTRAARPPDRRTMLLSTLGVGLATASWCASHDGPVLSADDARTAVPDRPRVLVAYFSRAGENYHHGGRADLVVGNTAVLVGMIADRLACDRYEVRAAEPYPDDYDATVRRNVEEQDADARPALADRLPDVSTYDVVLLASPLWNVRPPMIMRTLAEGLDLTGTTVHPVVTYAVSGLGSAARDYADACPGARLGEALAVRGEEVARAADDLDRWLASTGLVPG